MRVLTIPLRVQKIVGGALLLAAQSPHYAGLPVGLLFKRWRDALSQQNFHYTERINEAVGLCMPRQFMAWMFVSEAWINQLQRADSKLDYLGQAIEPGPYLFVIDLISPDLHPALMIRQVVRSIRKSRRLKGVVYLRTKGNKSQVYVRNICQT